MSSTFQKTALITGGTSGLGFHCALDIAQQHPEYLVILASRTDSNAAASSINKTLGRRNVVFLPLDLSSLANVRSFVKGWEFKDYPPIQILLLNAGLQFPNEVRYSLDGLEATFAINHVGHALLFHLLRPHFATKARIIVTASGTHDPAQKTGLPDAKYVSAEDLAHPTPESAKFAGRQRYATSKLVNVMWTYSLHRRLEGTGSVSESDGHCTVLAFDPGLMPGTGLAREASAPIRWLFLHLMPHMIPLLRMVVNPNIHTPRESGANLAWLATSPEMEGVSGRYYEGKKPIKSSVDSYDQKKQEDLWAWTIKTVAANKGEMEAFATGN